MNSCRLITLIVTLLTAGASLRAAPPEDLDTWIQAEMQRWEIPGLALVVVRDDAVEVARGYGTRRLGHDWPVGADTVFSIASLSKAMTATALAMLADEGLLHWDDPVVRHLPGFRLSDPWVTANVTVRDLLSHRVGVGRLLGNRLTFMPAATRPELVARMRFHEFEQPFRQGYVYSNTMYTVAGELIPAITGQSWDDFMRQRLFRPLGMQAAVTDFAGLMATGDRAWPHQIIEGEVVEIAPRDFGNIGPAAGIGANINDLARWLRFNLGEPGVIDGHRLLGAETIAELFAPAAITGQDEDSGEIRAYGLGWGLTGYGGYRVLQHTGAADGINSQIVLVPELSLGIAVSANLFNNLRTAIVRRLIDHYAGREPQPWSEELHAEYMQERRLAREARAAVHAARRQDAPPSRTLADYAGTYHHPLYDRAEVRLEQDTLVLTFWDDPGQSADLAHWHHDTFRATWRNPAQREKFVSFDLDESGQPHVLNVRFTLRPEAIEEGIYPAGYSRRVVFQRTRPAP